MRSLTIDQAIEEAVRCQSGGRSADAERLYRRVLAAAPSHPEAHHNLGVLLLELGRTEEALRHLKSALDAQPRDGQLWVSYVDALLHAGEHRQAQDVLAAGRRRGLAGAAVDSLQRRLDLLAPAAAPAPATPPAVAAAAAAPVGDDEKRQLDALLQAGRNAEAEAALHGLAQRSAHDAWPWKRLSALYRADGRLDEAMQAIRAALQRAGGDAEVHFELAQLFGRLGQLAEAEASLRRALQLDPGFAAAQDELGQLYERTGRLAEAEGAFRRALALRPAGVDTLGRLAVALQFQGRLAEAEAAQRQALALQPASGALHVELATTLRFQGGIEAAEAALRQAIAVQPDHGRAYAELAGLLRDTDRLGEAVQLLRQAAQRLPQSTEVRSALLFSLNYSAECTPQEALDEARRYGELVQQQAAAPYSSWAVAADPPRLRVGLLSGDLYAHPVGFFLEAVVAGLDRQRIELFAYPTHRRTDALTATLQTHCAAWRPLIGLSDAAAARQIHRDGIHVLLELSGHTMNNRLPITAWRPAPVQASWLGYFATTGVGAIDYFLADETSVPPAHRAHFSEQVCYLPETRLCFSPPADAPPVAPLPALRNGVLTFGCFQGLAKLSDRTLALWQRVLAAVPRSRLRIQSGRLASQAVCSRLRERCAAFGIEPQRLDLAGPLPRPQYLAAHAEVDLILDTTPFPGGTTTCEALWMGVPTLTLAGDRLIARQGAGLLRAARLPDWVAESEEAFVARAVALAGDLPRLAALRAGLRQQLRETPLFDGRRFAANLDAALWRMWRERSPAGQAVG